jgi:hypothetical protein
MAWGSQSGYPQSYGYSGAQCRNWIAFGVLFVLLLVMGGFSAYFVIKARNEENVESIGMSIASISTGLVVAGMMIYELRR